MLSILQKSLAALSCIATTALLLTLSGCVSKPETGATTETVLYVQPSPDEPIPVIRSGRYQLIEIGVTEGQHNLLQQIINVRIPRRFKDLPTVDDALRYILLDSGYHLCEGNTAFKQLPLPLIHAQIGPMRLSEALSMLAGPAWILTIDEMKRDVCFDTAIPQATREK